MLFKILLSFTLFIFSHGSIAQVVHEIRDATLQNHLNVIKSIKLPHKLDKNDFPSQSGTVRYSLSFTLEDKSKDKLGIYIRKMGLAGRVFLNGNEVGICEQGRIEIVRCLNRPYLFVPPVNYFIQGENIIEFEIFARSQQINGLSTVIVGDAEKLQQSFYKPAYFWIVEMLVVQMWISILLGIMSLLIAFMIRDGSLYLWVGLSSIIGAFGKAAILETHPWISVDFFTWAAYSLRIITMPLVFLAILGFFNKAKIVNIIITPLLIYATLAPIIIWLTDVNLKIISILYLPFVLMGCAILLAIFKWTYQSPLMSHLIITMVISILVILGLMDWARIRDSSSFDGVFLIPYGHSGLSVVFFAVVLGKVAKALRASRSQEQALEYEIIDRSQKLQVAQNRISEMERTLLKLTENIPVGTYVLETNAQHEPHFTFVSDRWLRMLDLERSDVLHDPLKGFQCVHPDDFNDFMVLNQKSFSAIEMFSWVGRVIVNNEIRWMSIESLPRRLHSGGAAWEGVMIDITANKESEAALKSAYEKLTAMEIARSTLEERERLLQDMHDGFGSQLSSARIMAERGALSQQQLKELLQECLSDLHLVADTLGVHGNSLGVALGDFRFRTERRVINLPIQIHWNQCLEQLPVMSDREILQIMRILQEAISNALKHASALNIWVEVNYLSGKNLLRLSVKDDGVGIPEKQSQGRGLNNMRRRAREIGATLSYPRQNLGTQLLIEWRLTDRN